MLYDEQMSESRKTSMTRDVSPAPREQEEDGATAFNTSMLQRAQVIHRTDDNGLFFLSELHSNIESAPEHQ